MSRDTPRDTFHHNLPFSTAICGNLRQYVCNMSAICLHYVCNIRSVHDLCQAHETPPISTTKITLHRHLNMSVRNTVLVLYLFRVCSELVYQVTKSMI